MTTGASLEALQWLTFVQEHDSRLINKNGERVKLHHKFYRGEKTYGSWTVDGFAVVDEKLFFFEYLGCFFHKGCRNPECKQYRYDFLNQNLLKF